MENYHVVEANGVWQLKAEGSDKVLKQAGTKGEIIEQMQDLMQDRAGSVKIHTRTGQIEEERTYPRKDDPRRSKG